MLCFLAPLRGFHSTNREQMTISLDVQRQGNCVAVQKQILGCICVGRRSTSRREDRPRELPPRVGSYQLQCRFPLLLEGCAGLHLKSKQATSVRQASRTKSGRRSLRKELASTDCARQGLPCLLHLMSLIKPHLRALSRAEAVNSVRLKYRQGGSLPCPANFLASIGPYCMYIARLEKF